MFSAEIAQLAVPGQGQPYVAAYRRSQNFVQLQTCCTGFVPKLRGKWLRQDFCPASKKI